MQGNITNYLPYFFKDGVLKGDFLLSSRQMNVNEFILAKQKSGKKQEKALMTVHIANLSTAEGTLKNPVVTPDLSKAIKTVTKEAAKS